MVFELAVIKFYNGFRKCKMADRTQPKSAEDYIFAKISANISKINIAGFSKLLLPNFTLDFAKISSSILKIGIARFSRSLLPNLTLDFGNLKWPTEHRRKVPRIIFSLKSVQIFRKLA